jgi:hypothetical protein
MEIKMARLVEGGNWRSDSAEGRYHKRWLWLLTKTIFHITEIVKVTYGKIF